MFSKAGMGKESSEYQTPFGKPLNGLSLRKKWRPWEETCYCPAKYQAA
jgi:hypothetical protein